MSSVGGPGVGWDGNLSTGWFSRDASSNASQDSLSIDQSIKATNGSAALGIPTGGPVNVSVGATTANGTVNGTQFGIGFPGPPSLTVTANWNTVHLNPNSETKKLW